MAVMAGTCATAFADSELDRKIYAASQGDYTPRANDCDTAIPVVVGTTYNEVGPGQVWFSYMGDGNGLEIETCLPGTNFDSQLWIYTGDCQNLTQVYYRDGDSNCQYASWATYLYCDEFIFADGVMHYILFNEYYSDDLTDTMTLEVSFTECGAPPEPPENDTMAGALPVTLNGDCIAGNTCDATDTTGPYGYGLCWKNTLYASSGLGKDMWYYVDLADLTHVQVDLCGSTYDTCVGLFDEYGVQIGGNDDSCGLQSEICCWLPAGRTYIAVDGYDTACGDFLLCVLDCPYSEAEEVPVDFALGQNYPNPFNPSTSIEFSVPQTGEVSLQVYNLSGDLVSTLVSGMVEQGEHTVTFNAADLATGVYFYTLEAENFSNTKKMVLLK